VHTSATGIAVAVVAKHAHGHSSGVVHAMTGSMNVTPINVLKPHLFDAHTTSVGASVHATSCSPPTSNGHTAPSTHVRGASSAHGASAHDTFESIHVPSKRSRHSKKSTSTQLDDVALAMQHAPGHFISPGRR